MDNQAVLDKIREVKQQIKRNSNMSTHMCNVLIVHRISAEIDRTKDQRYGQILRNLRVVEELRTAYDKPIGWKNDYQTKSATILARLGPIDEVRATISKHFKRNPSLQGKPVEEENTRYAYNKAINHLVIVAIQKYPEWNMGQILRNLEIVKEDLTSDFKDRRWVNDFNTESLYILKRAKPYQEMLEKRNEKDL